MRNAFQMEDVSTWVEVKLQNKDPNMGPFEFLSTSPAEDADKQLKQTNKHPSWSYDTINTSKVTLIRKKLK